MYHSLFVAYLSRLLGLTHLTATGERSGFIEQLNIVGKRSGQGFVAHKAKLVNALSRATASRIMLLDYTFGRKGLLGYVKALTGSNIVKIVPASNGGASGEQTADKRLKVVCGAITSLLPDMSWIGEKTPVTHAKVRVSPQNNVKCNLGSAELAQAIERVLPFTTKDDNRPTLRCILFRAGDGKLRLCSADGFRLAEVTLDYSDGEGEVLINRDDLRGIANAIRKAMRVRLDILKGGETLDGMKLVIDTELIQYEFSGVDGKFPDYTKLIPQDITATAHLDTVEAIKAIASFRALSDNPKSYPIDLNIGSNGGIVLSNPDDNGQASIVADVTGQVALRIDGKYFAEVMKACGGMVDLFVADTKSPIMFTTDGCQYLIMPIMKSADVSTDSTAEAEAEVEPDEPEGEELEGEAEPVVAE